MGLTSNHPSAQGWSSRPRRATAGVGQYGQFQHGRSSLLNRRSPHSTQCPSMVFSAQNLGLTC